MKAFGRTLVTKFSRRHHSLLHVDPQKHESGANKQNRSGNNLTGTSENPHVASFATAVVNVTDFCGNMHPCRVLLDSGSQCSLVSEAFVNRLRLKRRNAKISLSGIADSQAGSTRGMVNLELSSRFDNNNFIKIQALILKTLTSNIPQVDMSLSEYPYLKPLKLADPKCNRSQAIDVLIGCDYFFGILQNEWLNGGPNTPTAQSTYSIGLLRVLPKRFSLINWRIRVSSILLKSIWIA